MNEKKINPIYCGHKNRIFAFLVDFLCILLVTINLNLYVFLPIANQAFGANDIENQYYQDLADSGLYYIENDNCISIIANSVNQTEKKEYIDYLDNKLTSFYNNNLYLNADITLFNEAKLNNNNLFTYDEVNSKFVINSNASEDELIKFYESETNKAISILTNEDFILDKYVKVLSLRLLAIFISFTIPMFIFYLLIPLLNKKGKTIGKYLFNIGVMDNKNRLFVSKSQTVLRFTLIYIEYVLSLITFSAVFLISFAFSIFSKNNYSLHDLFCKTVDIDLKTSTFVEKIELKGE